MRWNSEFVKFMGAKFVVAKNPDGACSNKGIGLNLR